MLRPLLFGLLVACGGSSAPSTATTPPPPTPAPTTPGSAGACPAGQQMFAPGCGGGPAFEAGCYASCADAECAAGSTCTEVTFDPCHGKECDACGAAAKICLPAR